MSGDVHVQFCERPGVRFPRATHLALVRRRPVAARGVAGPSGCVSGASARVAAPGEDARGGDIVADDVPRLRAAARRASSAAGGERSAVPQPPARAPRPLAGGKCHSGRGGAAGFAPGWRTRRTPTRGGCAARSSGTGGSHRAGNRSWGPDRPPAVVWFAAAPGTTMPRTSGLARATGTPPATGTTTRVFAFRARPRA